MLGQRHLASSQRPLQPVPSAPDAVAFAKTIGTAATGMASYSVLHSTWVIKFGLTHRIRRSARYRPFFDHGTVIYAPKDVMTEPLSRAVVNGTEAAKYCE